MFLKLCNQLAGNLIIFFSVQLVYSLILFPVIYLLTMIFRNKSRLFILGAWVLLFIRLLLPINLSHSLSGRMFFQNFITKSKTKQKTIVRQNESSEEKIDYKPEYEHQKLKPYISSENLLVALWIGGVAILGLAYNNKLKKYNRILKNSVQCQDTRILYILNKWKKEFSIRRKVQIVTSNYQIPPFTKKTIQPLIFIPEHFIQKENMTTLETIIAHELAHIQKYDDLSNKMQNILQIIYFFNPVIWIAGRRISHIREELCDQSVLSRKKLSKLDYGNGLLDVIQLNIFQANNLPFLHPAISGSRQRLVSRIKNIKDFTEINHRHQLLYIFLLVFIGFIILPLASASNPDLTDIHFILPMQEGKIVVGYGKHWNGKKKEFYLHKGIDLSQSKYTNDIYASADGQVISTGRDEIFNKHREITIHHKNRVQTRYLHLDFIYVKPGQKVKQGQVIGKVSKTVHFEVYWNGKSIDPVKVLEMEKY